MIVVHSSDPLGYVPRGVARIAVLREDLDGEVRDGQPATVTAQAPGEFSIANLASWAGEAQRIGSLHRLTGLQRAARTGDFALRAAASALREGATDFQIAAAIEAAARARGADRARCLVGMGHSTALSEAHGAVYRPEQPVRLEVNLVQEGFASHAQRTLLPDTASVVDLEAVEVCHEAREALLTRISPGVAVSEVVAAGDQVLADFGLLGHKEGVFGHGLGWDIAEHPLLVADSSQTIQADSVLAVHVGVLSPGGETALVGGPVVVGESGSWELVPGACWTRSRSDLAVENRGTQDVGLLTSPHVAAVHGFPGPADGASFRRR
jgi:Xaa-Pro aminopeptidase